MKNLEFNIVKGTSQVILCINLYFSATLWVSCWRLESLSTDCRLKLTYSLFVSVILKVGDPFDGFCLLQEGQNKKFDWMVNSNIGRMFFVLKIFFLFANLCIWKLYGHIHFVRGVAMQFTFFCLYSKSHHLSWLKCTVGLNFLVKILK